MSFVKNVSSLTGLNHKMTRYMKNSSKIKAFEFFCGAGGLTRGFLNAGIEVLAGIDFDATLKATY
ncbi:MAG: hypothetical protein SNJ55_12570, partial [Chloroherpetonaceae bacterium]